MFTIHIWRRSQAPLARLEALERAVRTMAATQQQLDAAIAGLPVALAIALTPAISQAVETSIAPIIAALTQKTVGTPIDFQPEIDALNALPGAVASSVAPDVAASVASSLPHTQGVPATP